MHAYDKLEFAIITTRTYNQLWEQCHIALINRLSNNSSLELLNTLKLRRFVYPIKLPVARSTEQTFPATRTVFNYFDHEYPNSRKLGNSEWSE